MHITLVVNVKIKQKVHYNIKEYKLIGRKIRIILERKKRISIVQSTSCLCMPGNNFINV